MKVFKFLPVLFLVSQTALAWPFKHAPAPAPSTPAPKVARSAPVDGFVQVTAPEQLKLIKQAISFSDVRAIWDQNCDLGRVINNHDSLFSPRDLLNWVTSEGISIYKNVSGQPRLVSQFYLSGVRRITVYLYTDATEKIITKIMFRVDTVTEEYSVNDGTLVDPKFRVVPATWVLGETKACTN